MVIFDVADISTKPATEWPRILLNNIDVTDRVTLIQWHILDERGKWKGAVEQIEIPKSVKIEVIHGKS